MSSALLKQIKPLALSIHLATITLGMSVATVVSAQTSTSISIAAGDLVDALNIYALQQNVNLIVDGKSLAGFKTTGLQGHYSVEQGFNALLSHTPYQIQKINNGYTLVAKPQTQQSSRNMGELSTIDISAAEQARLENGVFQLPIITVGTQQTGSAADGYVAKSLKSVGPWGEKALQDTPYAMSVTSSDLIENAIASDMDQIYKLNPVVQNTVPASSTGNKAYAVIRGFHTQVGVMDGIRLSSYSTGISTEELDRVEIINGLTGFMYGVGNVGGTTNYVLKRPSYEPLKNITVGNYGHEQWFAHIDVGDKIDEDGTFAYRFNAAYQNGETGRGNQTLEKALVSGALDWNVTDDLLVQLEAAHTEYHLDGIESRFYAYANSSFGALGYWIKPLANNQTYTPDWTYWDTVTNRVGANLTYDINDIFTVRAAYIYKKDQQESANAYPLYFADSGYVSGWMSRSAPTEDVSQGAYVYLDSVFNTGDIQHKLIVGVSGDRLDSKRHQNGSISAANSPAYSNPNDLMSFERPAIFNTANWGEKYKSSTLSNQNIIIGDDIRFNEHWSALIGANYTTLKANNYDADGTKTSEYDASKLTPTASIIFKPYDELTMYVTYMQGLEQGSVIPNSKDSDGEYEYNNPGKTLDPSVSKQYEVGAKYAFNDNLLLSSALFRIEKANSYTERAPNGKWTMSQDGLAVHQGVELTLTGKVTDHLTLITGGTFMDLGIDKVEDKNLKGKEPTGVSNVLAKIYAEYQLPELEGLSLTGGAYHSGSKYKDNANLQNMAGYTIFDIGARYQTKIQSVPTTFNFNVANLFNKDYWATTFSLGVPRTVSFSVKTQF